MRYYVIEGRLDTPGEKHLILSDRSIGEDRNRLSYNISSNDSRYPYQFVYFARFHKELSGYTTARYHTLRDDTSHQSIKP